MKHRITSTATTLIIILLLNFPLTLQGQTPVKAPKNPYSVDKDVQLGQQAAAEVERQLPLIRDREVEDEVLGGLTSGDRRQLLTLLRRALDAAPPQPAWQSDEGD